MASGKNHSRSLLKYFFTTYRHQSIFVILALIGAGVAELVGIGALLPLIAMVLDGGSSSNDSAVLGSLSSVFGFFGVTLSFEILLLTIVCMIVLKAVIVFAALRYASYVAADVARDFRYDLMSSLMKAKWSYFSNLSVGRISNMISSEAQRAGHCYLLAGRTAAALIQVLIYITVAFAVSWSISLLAIVMGVVVAFLIKGFVRMARKAGQDMTKSTNDMLVRLNESLSAIKPLKSMGCEDRYIELLRQNTSEAMAAQKLQYKSALLMQVVHEPMAVILLAVGLYGVITYTATPVPVIILLALLFYRLMTQANLVQNFYQNMVQNEPAVWGLLREIEEADTVREKLPEGITPTLTKGIALKDVGFSYDGRQYVLKNFSTNIPALQLSVIFAPSGSGKTTLVDLILGLLMPSEGIVEIDGMPINEVDVKSWRRMVGYVPQDTFLFHDTIFNNLTLGDNTISREDAEYALKGAALWDFVGSLPDGMDSIVGERGGKLSGGQRQRIALARALVRNPALLILDEATSGLDSENQKKVLETVKDLSGKTTVIIISHDASVLPMADNVVRMTPPRSSEEE